MDIPSLLIQLLNGVQYGLLLFLVASGLTLVFGVLSGVLPAWRMSRLHPVGALQGRFQ